MASAIIAPVDDVRIGRLLRILRRRRSLRQVDLARIAGTSQPNISRLEAGRLSAIDLGRLRAVARALDAELVIALRWHGGEIDRLADEAHAALVGATIVLLESLGWLTQPEVSFSVYGERGSIDILAWHPTRRILLVVEVKTELVSVEETLRRHDAKERLAAAIARERFGWEVATVGRLLVFPASSTERRRVERHAAVLDRAYPDRGTAARRWLRNPTGPFRGLLFIADPRARRRSTTGSWRPGERPMGIDGRAPQAEQHAGLTPGGRGPALSLPPPPRQSTGTGLAGPAPGAGAAGGRAERRRGQGE